MLHRRLGICACVIDCIYECGIKARMPVSQTKSNGIILVFAGGLVVLGLSLLTMASGVCYREQHHDWYEISEKPYGFEYISEYIMQCKYHPSYSYLLLLALVGVLIQAWQLGYYIFEIQTHICILTGQGDCRRSPVDSDLDAFIKVLTVIAAVMMVVGASMLGLYDATNRSGDQNYGREHGVGVGILVTGFIFLKLTALIYRIRIWAQDDHNLNQSKSTLAFSVLLNLALIVCSFVFLLFFFMDAIQMAILSEHVLIFFALSLQAINLYWLYLLKKEEKPLFYMPQAAKLLGTAQPT